MSLTAPKPTGVFVRLPLSSDDIRRMDRAMSQNLEAHAKPTLESASEAALLAIGVPVAAGDLETFTNRDPSVGNVYVTYVRQSEAQAQIAARDAEIVRLQELLASCKRENFNAGYLIACCNIFNMHNEEGIAADILREAGISETEVKALDLNEYDAEALVVIRGASNDDPILKGGAA